MPKKDRRMTREELDQYRISLGRLIEAERDTAKDKICLTDSEEEAVLLAALDGERPVPEETLKAILEEAERVKMGWLLLRIAMKGMAEIEWENGGLAYTLSSAGRQEADRLGHQPVREPCSPPS